ncbi:ABC transporter substrate-binding protein [Nocardioides sp. GCM10027113]|uniref:ABC transporter substrate-binding protein n=1 Tax=unclassified Nocardioides TaxID=2615069 RepID=UPI0036226191
MNDVRTQTSTAPSAVRTPRRRLHRWGALVAAVALTASACGGDNGDTAADGGDGDLGLIQSGTLTVCSDVPYPPFDTRDGDTYTGFDGDLINEIASRLELDVSLRDQAFEGLQSGLALNSQQCDLVSAAMTITEEREQNLDFSEGYYDSKQSLLVPEDSDIESIEDLDGVQVAVQQGTTGKTYAEENAPEGAELVTFPSDGEMYTAIKAGQIGAILQDLPVNLSHEQDGGFKVVETYDTGEQYGFGFREEGSDALQEAVNGALQDMRDDGTYDEIYNKYFATDAE